MSKLGKTSGRLLRKSKKLSLLLICVLLIPVFIAACTPPAQAYFVMGIDKIWCKVTINADSTITLFYNITSYAAQGTDESYYEIIVGMPNDHFSIVGATDPQGNTLRAEKNYENGPGVGVYWAQEAGVEERRTLYLTVTVEDMLYQDSQNPGNIGIQFTPTWYSDSDSRIDLRVIILAPPRVSIDEIKDMVRRDNNVTQDNLNGVFWERTDWSASQEFKTGISFPASYITATVATEEPNTGIELPNIDWIWVLPVIVIAIIIIGALISKSRDKYETPSLSIESLDLGGEERKGKVRKDLDPIEAAVLLRMHPGKIVSMILFSMAKKKALKIMQTKPTIVVEKTRFDANLRYYEKYMKKAILDSGKLDEEELIKVLKAIRQNVDDKMRYYDRRDTEAFYQKKVEDAWKDVELAKVAEVKFKKYNDNMLWLMVDKDFGSESKRVLGSGSVSVPREDYDFYTYYYRPIIIVSTPPRTTVPTTIPTTTTPTTPTPPTSTNVPVVTPIENFANSFCTQFENMTTGVIVNIEKAIEAVAPKVATTKTESHTTSSGSSGSSCHCACDCVHSCACHCACVSCACACAGGGGHCFKMKYGMKSTAIRISHALGCKMMCYPVATVLPMSARPEYGFYLTTPSGGTIHVWSTSNTDNFFLDNRNPAGQETTLTEQETTQMWNEIRRLGESDKNEGGKEKK